MYSRGGLFCYFRDQKLLYLNPQPPGRFTPSRACCAENCGSAMTRVRFVKPIFSNSCSNQILRLFSRSVFCVDFEFTKINNNVFSNLTPRSHDDHFWRPRVKSNDYSQILPKDAECDCNQYSRKKLTIFLAIWPLAAIQKAKNCHFSQSSELT